MYVMWLMILLMSSNVYVCVIMAILILVIMCVCNDIINVCVYNMCIINY